MYYVLEDKQPKKVSLMKWATWFQANYGKRHVGNTKVNGVRVSTVFLGVDHRFSDSGPPLLFETMIFGGEHDQKIWRCSTWKQAEIQHWNAVRLVNNKDGAIPILISNGG